MQHLKHNILHTYISRHKQNIKAVTRRMKSVTIAICKQIHSECKISLVNSTAKVGLIRPSIGIYEINMFHFMHMFEIHIRNTHMHYISFEIEIDTFCLIL